MGLSGCRCGAPGPGVNALSLLHWPCCPSVDGVLAYNCPRRPTLTICKTQIYPAVNPSAYQITRGWLRGYETTYVRLLPAGKPGAQGCPRAVTSSVPVGVPAREPEEGHPGPK